MARLYPIITLRIGLAFVFLYAGIDAFLHPNTWLNWVPLWVESAGFTGELFLKIHSGLNILIGVSFLAGFIVRLTSIFAFLSLTAIVVFSGFEALPITFRDIGLALAVLALLFEYWRRDEEQDEALLR